MTAFKKSKIFIINYLNQKGIDKNLLEEALNNYEYYLSLKDYNLL